MRESCWRQRNPSVTVADRARTISLTYSMPLRSSSRWSNSEQRGALTNQSKEISVKLMLLIGFLVVNGWTNAYAQTKQESLGADLIVHNAKIFTGSSAQPAATALAVRSGRIYAVGTDAEVLGLKSPATRIIDSGGRRLIPGIIDAHTHVINEGGYNYTLRWDGVPTLRRALAMLSDTQADDGHLPRAGENGNRRRSHFDR
jgi:hypothetical protein